MMAGANSSEDWPTLSDSNNACASTSRNKQHDNSKDKPKIVDSSSASSSSSSSASEEISEKETSEVNPDVENCATGLDNEGTSTESNKTGARRKKHNGKTKWTPVPINLLPYRDNRSERHYNDSHRFGANNRRFNNHESTNNVSGHEHYRGRGFRGGRGGRGNAFRSRRENVNSDTRRYQRVPQEAACAPQIGAENVNASMDVKEAVKEQLMRQIEYYFSDKNLVRDTYLRHHMDEQGYAQLSLIANFPRIRRLTNDMQLILEAVKKSSHLEVSDDVKVRPVVAPLRWPITDLSDKAIIGGDASANIRETFVDFFSSQFYSMSLDPTVYQHLPGLKSHLPNELSWQYIPVGNQNKNGRPFLCMVNSLYPTVDSNDLSVSTNNSNIPNGHAGSPEQLNSPNSDLADELQCGEPVHQYHQTIDFENKVSSFLPECFLSEIPPHIDSNGVSSIADNLNIPNGHSSSDSVSDIQRGLNSELASQYKLNDCQSKTNAPFYPVTGIYPHADSDNSASPENSTISNGLASQYKLNDCQSKTNALFYPVTGTHPHADSDNSASPENSTISNGLASQYKLNDCQSKTNAPFYPVTGTHPHADSDNSASTENETISNGLASQYKLNDCQSKTNAPFYPVTGTHPHADSDNSASTENETISNGLACSSDLRPVDEINAYNCYYGQISNGVIMYNSGGRYYVEPSNEILADSTDSSEDKSTVHNKSPEPSR